LVVDDSLISRSIIEELLSDLDIACISTDSGEKALEILTKNEPDIIFVDHVMLGMDGLELCRRIRAMKGAFTYIPVIVLTGKDVNVYKEEYSKAGFSGWLTKPININDLEHFLPIRKTIEPKGVSAKAVKSFIEHTHRVIPEMNGYIADSNLQRYAIEVHNLKSDFKLLGSNELSDLARELEKLVDKGDIEVIREKQQIFVKKVMEFVKKIAAHAYEGMPVRVENHLGKRTILAIDDSQVNLQGLDDALGKDYNVHTELSGICALKYLSENIPDIILLDIKMPEMDGYEVMAALKSDPRLDDIPVVFLTGSEYDEDEAHAFETGAVDYIKKPIKPAIVQARIKLHLEFELYRKNLEKMVAERTEKLELTADAILSLLANVSSYHDEETGTHILRTTDYAKLLVKLIQEANPPGYYINAGYGEFIIKSAKLHDIGKVAIPNEILLKPGRLTPEEFDKMKTHAVIGAQMLDDAIRDLHDDSYLRVAREIVIGHHEKWNGMGYPYGLKGDEIPISARIMAIADVYDALISERPYKRPFSHEKAVEIILGDSGTHFDPVILEIARDHLDEFDRIARKHRG